MAKSVQPVIEAFLNGENKKINNTKANNGKLYLFGNMIAKIDLKVGKIMITTCGWNTPTTRDRLNMLPGIWISSKKEQLFIRRDNTQNWETWDGNWIYI